MPATKQKRSYPASGPVNSMTPRELINEGLADTPFFTDKRGSLAHAINRIKQNVRENGELRLSDAIRNVQDVFFGSKTQHSGLAGKIQVEKVRGLLIRHVTTVERFDDDGARVLYVNPYQTH